MLCDLRKAGHHSGPLRFLTSHQSSGNASEEKGMAVDHMTANVQRSPLVPQRCRAAGMKGRWREGMVLLPPPTLPASRGQSPNPMLLRKGGAQAHKRLHSPVLTGSCFSVSTWHHCLWALGLLSSGKNQEKNRGGIILPQKEWPISLLLWGR